MLSFMIAEIAGSRRPAASYFEPAAELKALYEGDGRELCHSWNQG